MALPTFRYYPNPVRSGSMEPSDEPCSICGQVRGYLYTATVYDESEGEDQVYFCHQCIADGSAHEAFDYEFNDDMGLINYKYNSGKLSQAVMDEITQRTPSYTSWQTTDWFCHCNDGGAFLGQMGHQELLEVGPEAIRAIQDSTSLYGDEWEEFFEALDKDESPRAYLFQCLHCGHYGGYTDCD